MATFTLRFQGRGHWTTRSSHLYHVKENGWVWPTIWRAGRWEEDRPRKFTDYASGPGKLALAFRRAKNMVERRQVPDRTWFGFCEESPRTLVIDLDEDGNYRPNGMIVKL